MVNQDMKLETWIRDIPDFPKPGIIFKDITPLLGEPGAFSKSVDMLAERISGFAASKIVAAEARGFLFGSALAYKMGLGCVPVRKPGKLPGETISASYELEYGTDTLCMHADALRPGERVLIVDDVLATGGTALGMVDLVQKGGGVVAGLGFLMELDFLHGRDKLGDYQIVSLLHVSGE